MKRIGLIILVLGIFFSTRTAQAVWSTAQRLTWTSDASERPAIAIGAGNSLHAVWQDLTPGNWEIYYKNSSDGGATWSAVKRLTWNSGDSFAPDVAIDSGNTVHVVWHDNTPGNYEIYHKKSTDGGTTWSSAKRLTWTLGGSTFSAIAVDGNDTVQVVWEDDTPGNLEVYHKSSTDKGTTWSVAQRLTWTSGNSYTPALAIDSGNAIHIAWCDDTPGNPEIYYMRSTDADSTWSVAQRLTWTSGKSYDAAIAIDPTGPIHIVWDDDTPGNYEIYAKRSTDGGSTWSTAQRLTSTSLESLLPAIAIDSGSAIHVVWSDYTPGNPEIYHRKSTNGGTTWSTIQRLTWTLEDSASPAMAIDSSGTIHVAWEDFTPGNYEIYYKKGN